MRLHGNPQREALQSTLPTFIILRAHATGLGLEVQHAHQYCRVYLQSAITFRITVYQCCVRLRCHLRES